MKLAAIGLVAILLLFGCSVLAGAAQSGDPATIDLDSSPFGALAKLLVPVTPIKIGDLRPRAAPCVQSGLLSIGPGQSCIYDITVGGGVRSVTVRMSAGNNAQLSIKQGNLTSELALSAFDSPKEFRLSGENTSLTVLCGPIRCAIRVG